MKIKFYGEYRSAVGKKDITLEVLAPVTVLDILTKITHLTPQLTVELAQVYNANDYNDCDDCC